MKESEIFDKLCCFIRPSGAPLDNSFFKRCYAICMKNKDQMTEKTICEIVNNEYELVEKTNNQFNLFINSLNKRYE